MRRLSLHEIVKLAKSLAVGREAALMQGKTHENIKTIRPLKDGVIADFDASEKMIKYVYQRYPCIKEKMDYPFTSNGNMYS